MEADWTGNTLQDHDRLSISGYHIDRSKFFEYENLDLYTHDKYNDIPINDNDNNNSNRFLHDNNSSNDDMSDILDTNNDFFNENKDNEQKNAITNLNNQYTNAENILNSNIIIDLPRVSLQSDITFNPTDEIDPVLNKGIWDMETPLICGTNILPKKKMRDYFKFNIFNNTNTNGDNEKSSFWRKKLLNRKSSSNKDKTNDITIDLGDEYVDISNDVKDDSDMEIETNEDNFRLIEELNENNELESLVIEPSQIFQHPESISLVKEETLDMSTNPFIQNDNIIIPDYSRVPNVPNMPKVRGRKQQQIPDFIKHFDCDYCGRRFKRQEHLKRHIRSLHLNNKPYDCKFCDKKFSRSDNFNQHLKIHKTDR